MTTPPPGQAPAGPAAGHAGPSPAAIVRLTTAYWDSQVLLTANRLRVFDALATGPRTPDEVAQELKLDQRATGLFLRALTSLGFLEEKDGRFANAPVAAAFLVSRSPAFMGNALAYSDNLWATWGNLEQSLRQGRPAMPAEQYLGGDLERTRTFVKAMHERALGVARALVGTLDLAGRKALLDVGGGPGTYAVLLTGRFPGLKAEVLELPGVAAVARELIAAQGAADRVSVRDGDYHATAFGHGKDVVLMSGMFHRESWNTCRELVRRAHACLDTGGILAVSDVFTDEGGTGPVFATHFGLNMMLTAPDGGVHADADVKRWMAEAGFTDVRVVPLPPPMPHRVVIGTKA